MELNFDRKPWDSVRSRLQKSSFRSRFTLKGRDLIYLESRGMEAVRFHALRFISERLSPAQPKNDGKQTPMRGHPVFTAQHATATCCRGCLSKWHGIEKGAILTETEMMKVTAIIMGWIHEQTGMKNDCA